MRTQRRLCLIVVLTCLFGMTAMRIGVFSNPAWADPPEGSLNQCEKAGIAAEQAGGLPTGLLLAIGRVESGRWDASRGRTTSWPWTINAAGRGQWFDSRDAAAQAVKALLDSGTRSIDVGCFQINLMYHPQAFTTPEQGFDPDINARYAARFLLNLFSRTGSWEAAVEAYHSADPIRGFAYRQQVFSGWGVTTAASTIPIRPAPGPVRAAARVTAMPIPMIIAGVAVWTPMPAGTWDGVVVMPGSAPRTGPRPPPTDNALPPLPVVSYSGMPKGLLKPR